MKIDQHDHIDHMQELKKENQELRKEIEVLNARHIDHVQVKRENQELRKEIEDLNAQIKRYRNQLSIITGNYQNYMCNIPILQSYNLSL